MADITIAAINELKALPAELHWFCSRSADDENDRCYDEDHTLQELSAETEDEKKARKERADAAGKRKATVLNAVLIFAFDGSEAIPLQEWVAQRLDHLMHQCDVCVRTFHASRVELKEKLDADYDEEDVVAFLDKFDGVNVERIKRGLQHAERQLLHLAPEKRRVGSLDPEGLYALFEAMNCEPYLRNEHLMRSTFDQPFRLVQTTKKLRLPTFLPAHTYFIFSADKERQEWAAFAWSKLARPPTSHEFDYMIKKPLELALRRVQMQALEVAFLPDFYYGVNVVVSKLTADLIMHSLRPMEGNLIRLALDQFSLKDLDVSTFVSLCSMWKNLLEKSPEAFWDSMRSIPATSIVEQCFKSPALGEILMRPTAEGMPRMEDVFAWIQPFLASIKGNQVTACGALVREFVSRSKNDHLDRSARSYCFTLALHIIDQTLKGMNRPKSFDSYVGSAVSAQMLDELADQLPLILEQTRSIKNGTTTDDDASTALSIIENAIMLDIRVLDQDHKAIEFHKPRGHTTPKKSEKFWRALTRGTASGDQALVTRVLLGARDIVILDKFPPKFTPREPAEPKQFSDVYDERCTSISEFLERVSEFPNFQLAGLFKTPETASSIVHLLFAPDQSVRQGALEIFKAMSGGSGRLEGITYVLESAFHSFLVAFTKSINEISGKNMFPPLPGMIRLCSDVIEALCNSTTGILKLRNLTQQEIDATGEIWTGLWAVLTTIFQHMETWGLQGYDKNYMMEFCRNTMEFADTLFDQYSVFLNALSEDYDDDKQQLEKAKSLLQYPRGAMNTVVRWLRLRDEFLIDKILTLVTSLLARLSKNHINASDAALDYIEEVANKRVRTNLKSTQLALLRDAIDKYTGRQIALKASQEKEKKKAAKQTQLNAWATLGRSRDDAIDLDSDADSSRSRTIADATKNMEKFKQLKAEKDAKKLSLNNKKPAAPAKPVVDRAEFLKKRKLAEEAERKRKAALVAEARGNMPGSAINSVGLATKDHSTKGQGVMVDSDEDSSGSDSDEDSEDEGNPLDRELFGSKKKTAKPANAMSEAEALKKQQAMAGPVKVRKIQRSAKDMRARLAPDLSKLHQEILSWDYFHDGHYPPNTRPEQYQSIPKNVETAEQYMKIFKPLLVLETWSKISSDKNQDSQSRPYEVKVITRASVDAFVEVNTSIPHPTGDQRPEVSEGDLVLLSKEKDPRGSPHAPSCLGRIHKVSRKKQHIEVLYRVMPGNKLMNNLNGGNALNALKVESLITVEREYGALVGLQFYDLNEYIMQAAPSRLLKYAERELAPLMQNYKLNEAQAKAVKSALDNDAFTLIQGPPGSGKTKTIVATVGALLSNTLKNAGSAIARPGMTNGAATSTANSKKLLICAPSNAAVDELVLRFKDGVRLTSGQDKKINVVRLGRSEKINPQVLEVTLEELVSARLNKAAGNSENQRQKTQELMMEHKEVSRKLNEAHDKQNEAEQKKDTATMNALEDEIFALRRRKKELSTQIDLAKDKEQNASRQNDLEKKRVEQQILDEAHILCATLSASGHDRFQNLSLEFETVIVDEAAQCTELSALIPLKYGAAKCILVGDPKQLPPTTFMDQKLNFQYEQSLFVRMQNNSPQDVHLLDTQYRMHPEISAFPSQVFYESRLLDGDGMAKLREKPWHADPMLGPYRFFDVQGQQSSSGSSLTNMKEIDAAMRLFNKLIAACGSYDFSGKIGIITPYKAQFNAMKRRFQDEYGKSILDTIEFNTTDAFQGRECEIIIFSCVRANEGSIGFLNDYRRMNVGLTRAKCSLWVLGHAKSLVNGKFWRMMIEDAQRRNRISPALDIGKAKPPSVNGAYRPVQDHATRLNYEDGDTVMGGNSGVNSSNASRRSSASSMSSNARPAPTGPSSNSRPIPTGPAADRVKKENIKPIKRESNGDNDIDMQDVFDSDTTVKSESKDGKPALVKQEHRVAAPGPPPKATGAGAGYMVPPPKGPAQMPVKRKKPGNGALLENKRPKKN